MKIMKLLSFSGASLIGVEIAFAQNVNGRPVFELLNLAQALVSRLVPFLIGLAMVVFFYGLVMFIWKGKEGGESLEKGKRLMMYGIGALFVMVSIWGIIALIQTVLGVDPSVRPGTVYVPGQNQ